MSKAIAKECDIAANSEVLVRIKIVLSVNLPSPKMLCGASEEISLMTCRVHSRAHIGESSVRGCNMQGPIFRSFKSSKLSNNSAEPQAPYK